jgi:ElaB/YqjD/DUF883 family membrane-anchored ribosome-binding protein
MANMAREQRRVSKSFQEAGQAARQMASDGMERVKDTATEYWDQGRAKAEEVAEDFQDRVREQPLAAVLIAAGVGFLFGFACAIRR